MAPSETARFKINAVLGGGGARGNVVVKALC
jgi:hypothetical protein